ncbi:2'-5' RNA ligase [Alicyclobacillus fastidiosus]|nr:2'-5' RNA ligase [Alicyclobacillus fastidiosus]
MVFPFESALSTDELRIHLQDAILGVKPFDIVMSGVTGAEEEYLFLNVKVGNDEIIQLRDKLYTGILRPYLNRSLTYIPHLTVGRIKDKEEFRRALEETERFNEIFETTVHEIVVEIIDASEMSVIELKMPL